MNVIYIFLDLNASTLTIMIDEFMGKLWVSKVGGQNVGVLQKELGVWDITILGFLPGEFLIALICFKWPLALSWSHGCGEWTIAEDDGYL